MKSKVASKISKTVAPANIFKIFMSALYTVFLDVRVLRRQYPTKHLIDLFDVLSHVPETLLDWRKEDGRRLVEKVKAFNGKWRQEPGQDKVLIHLPKNVAASDFRKGDIAPEPYFTALMSTLRHGLLHCRDCLSKERMPRKQVADLCDALHNIPWLVAGWEERFHDVERLAGKWLRNFDKKCMDKVRYCRFDLLPHFCNELSLGDGEFKEGATPEKMAFFLSEDLTQAVYTIYSL